MPHRPPNPIDGDVFPNPTATGGATVELSCEHPQEPDKIVGHIVRLDDENYSAYACNPLCRDEIGNYLGAYTSIRCAIVNLEYQDGRLTKKPQVEFACPDCGETVKSVMIQGSLYNKSKPQLVDTVKAMIVSDEWGNGRYRNVTGYQVHECEDSQ